jgi:hypothetical protein
MGAVAAYLSEIPDLTLGERYVLCSVPINLRDRLAMQAVYTFARAHATKRPMPVTVSTALSVPKSPPGEADSTTKPLLHPLAPGEGRLWR